MKREKAGKNSKSSLSFLLRLWRIGITIENAYKDILTN